MSDATGTTRAAGPFEVKMGTLDAYNRAEGAGLARFSLDKTFHGDLEATSQGEMLSAGDPSKGSAGYVAVERVTGTLHGRRGSFSLMHRATMTRGTPSLSITVVPDTGTDELAGLSGTMDIVIESGKHSYLFDYTIAPN